DSLATPNVDVTVGSGGIVAGAGAGSFANVSDKSRAYLGPTVHVGSAASPAGRLLGSAGTNGGAPNPASVGSGGGVTARGSDVEANLSPDLAAYLGQNVQAYVTGNVDVLALSHDAEGHATAASNGGGGVDVGIPYAAVSSTPTVKSYIGSS